MAELALRGVSKTFGSGVQALLPVDLTIKSGQFAVLVGPSGCGKSTLLRIVAGLEEASGGTVSIDGVSVTNSRPKDRDVAMVFQNYALYPHMTVRQNLEFGLKMRGIGEQERGRQIASVAEMLQLEAILGRFPRELSGGQQQRVAVGRAIVRRPKLFLLDEPFSNLDATLRAATRSEMLHLHRRLGITTLFVTHDQVEAMSMADVLVVMKDGKVQQIGPPLDIYRHPANDFVAQFIGYPPMNVLTVAVLDRGTLDIAGHRLSNAAPQFAANTPVRLGLRAEHIHIVSADATFHGHPWIPAKVMFLEPLGNETIISCVVGGQDIVTRVPASNTIRPGQEVRLALNLREALYFDAFSGSALEPISVLT